MNFKGTKGTWRYSTEHECVTTSKIGIVEGSKTICDVKQAPSFDYTGIEALANAELIADAGNTINKCGLLPSELLEHRNELIKSLKSMLYIFDRNLFEGELGYDVCEKAKQTINKI